MAEFTNFPFSFVLQSVTNIVPNSFALMWDEINTTHISKHKVTKAEVEEVCEKKPQVYAVKYGRFIAVGATKTDRLLAIILEKKDEYRCYVVTARDASRKERRWYTKLKGTHDST